MWNLTRNLFILPSFLNIRSNPRDNKMDRRNFKGKEKIKRIKRISLIKEGRKE